MTDKKADLKKKTLDAAIGAATEAIRRSWDGVWSAKDKSASTGYSLGVTINLENAGDGTMKIGAVAAWAERHKVTIEDREVSIHPDLLDHAAGKPAAGKTPLEEAKAAGRKLKDVPAPGKTPATGSGKAPAKAAKGGKPAAAGSGKGNGKKTAGKAAKAPGKPADGKTPLQAARDAAGADKGPRPDGPGSSGSPGGVK